MIKGVPEWIHGTAEAWAREVRRFEKKIKNIKGTMGRIREEGPVGASIRGGTDFVPDVDFKDEEVKKFHRAWLDLDVNPRHHVWIHFKEFGAIREKVQALDTNSKSYYDTIRHTLCKMAAEFHLYD